MGEESGGRGRKGGRKLENEVVKEKWERREKEEWDREKKDNEGNLFFRDFTTTSRTPPSPLIA